MDTLFSLGSTYMFAQLVEHMDAQPQLYANKKGYKQVFNEIIEAIDWCHRDGARRGQEGSMNGVGEALPLTLAPPPPRPPPGAAQGA